MPKIIHAADIHLDAPFSLFDVQKAQVRKNELRGAFTSMILYAKTEKADMVIISGDLFDSGFATKETMSLIISQFASLPECKFVIVPGNHDPITPRSPYKKEVFPPNVYIFEDEKISKFSFDDIGVDVYGFAFTSETYTENPLVSIQSLDRHKINILAIHTDLYSKSTCCPLTPADIGRHGFDYVAMGHIHKGGEIMQYGSTYYAYSGCLEGRSFDECGIKGVILCNLEKNAGRLTATFANKRICRRHYEKLTVDITGVSTSEALCERVKAAVTAAGFGSDTLLRVRLTGRISPEAPVSEKVLTENVLGVYYLEVDNASLPLLDYENLKNDISIRGAFFRELLPLLESEDEAQRKTAADALRYGLAALDGGDVVDF